MLNRVAAVVVLCGIGLACRTTVKTESKPIDFAQFEVVNEPNSSSGDASDVLVTLRFLSGDSIKVDGFMVTIQRENGIPYLIPSKANDQNSNGMLDVGESIAVQKSGYTTADFAGAARSITVNKKQEGENPYLQIWAGSWTP